MKNLTLGDETQLSLVDHLCVTERLLACAASEASGSQQCAEIWLMPDLGLPHNIGRMHGGFFTGALYTWQSSVPMVPVDTTVNSCGVSVFRVNLDIETQEQFDGLIRKAAEKNEGSSTYIWNFASGNHFIIYGKVEGSTEVPDGRYIVLHSSAAEFKKQHNGLYPIKGNWFSDNIKTIQDKYGPRYIRYIEGSIAERFVELAQSLERFNYIRHQYFAGLVFGEENIEEEVINVQHYGMPAVNAAAVGCQWLPPQSLYMLLTAPERPLFFVRTVPGGDNTLVLDNDKVLELAPHGLGVRSSGSLRIEYLRDSLLINGCRYSPSDSLRDTQGFSIRSFSVNGNVVEEIPGIVARILSLCPGRVVATLQQLYCYRRLAQYL